MNLKQLYYFRALGRTQHMGQASKQLYITQPSLSHAISELENELGVNLFEKQGRNICLTKYGASYLEYVDKALDTLEEGNAAVKQRASPDGGKVDLAFIYTLGPFFVPRLIEAFLSIEEYRNIAFSFFQSNTNHVLNSLKEKKSDLAICSMPDPDPEIEFTVIAEQELVIIVNKNHPLSRFNEIMLEDLSGCDLIAFNQKSGLRPIIDQMLERAGVKPAIVYEVEEDHTMAGFVSIGYGIGIMPRIPALDSYHVKTISIKNPCCRRFIYAAVVKDRYISPPVNTFYQFIVKYGQEHFLNSGIRI